MFGKQPVIGPSARTVLRRASPFASLLVNISQNLTKEEFTNLRLAVSVDRQHIASKRRLYGITGAADLLQLLEERGIISREDLGYLENLLVKFGRKDLVKKIEKYHRKRLEETSPKVSASPFTKLKTVEVHRSPPVGMSIESRGSSVSEQENVRPACIGLIERDSYVTLDRKDSLCRLPSSSDDIVSDSSPMSLSPTDCHQLHACNNSTISTMSDSPNTSPPSKQTLLAEQPMIGSQESEMSIEYTSLSSLDRCSQMSMSQ